jgi:hypothetical protein
MYFSPTLRFSLNAANAIVKARSSGTFTVKAYYDQATSATTLTSTASAVNSGKALACPDIPVSQPNLIDVIFEFYAATADFEMELWSFGYGIEVMGRF